MQKRIPLAGGKDYIQARLMYLADDRVDNSISELVA